VIGVASEPDHPISRDSQVIEVDPDVGDRHDGERRLKEKKK
jgi:hypothetical protein